MNKPSRLLRLLSIFFVLLAATSVASAGHKPSRSEQLRKSSATHSSKGNTASAERAQKMADHHAKLEERDRKRAADKAQKAQKRR